VFLSWLNGSNCFSCCFRVEDKKAIGTIRTYGVGADVAIMYGGLLQELENPGGEIDKYLLRTIQSLDEVIAICRNSGFS
jgi:hypothetical protein